MPSDSAEWIGLFGGGLMSIAGIAAAYHVYVRRPGPRRHRCASASRGCTASSSTSGTSTSSSTGSFVRPVRGAGDFGRRVIETEFVQDTIVGGATGIVRAGTSLARAVQTGYVRVYALTLLAGLGGLALYFLISST